MHKGTKGTNHCLINGVSGFVWEDAGGQAGHHLFHAKLVSRLQHIVIDVDVVSLKKNKKNNTIDEHILLYRRPLYSIL